MKYYARYFIIFFSLFQLSQCKRISKFSARGFYSEKHFIWPDETVTITSRHFPKESPKFEKQENYYISSVPQTRLLANCSLEIKNGFCHDAEASFVLYKSEADEDMRLLYCNTQQITMAYFEYVSIQFVPGLGGNRFQCNVTSNIRPGATIPLYLTLNYTAPKIEFSKTPAETTCDCGRTNDPIKARIINGSPTGENEYTWMVALFKRLLMMEGEYDHYFCGGSLITNRHVLSAAHCFADTKNIYARVQAYDNSEPDPENSIKVIKVINHNYNKYNHKNDISILLLERDVEFNLLVGPACLPSQKEDFVDKFVKIIGWGRMFDPPKKFAALVKAEILQQTDNRILPLEICKQYVSRTVDLDETNQICNFNPGFASCKGDSGGPINLFDKTINKYKIIGLVSYGVDKCGFYKPKVSTDVSAYIEWIKEKVAGSEEPREICTPVR